MNNSPAEILANYLIAQGIFSDPTSPSPVWPLFIGFMPDWDNVPDSAAAIYDTDGVKDGRSMRDGEYTWHYGLQLKTRAIANKDSWKKLADACSRLKGIDGSQVLLVGADTYTLRNMSQTSPQLFMGLEEGRHRRNLHTANFLATIDETADGTGEIIFTREAGVLRQPILLKAVDFLLSDSDSGKVVVTKGATGAVQLTLPPWSAGLFYTFFNDNDLPLTILSRGDAVLRVGGQESGLGGNVSNSKRGSSINLSALSTGEWVAQLGYTGNWSVSS